MTPPAAKVLRWFCGLACVAFFALPIVGMIIHTAAVNQAEREFEAQQSRHRAEMERMIREYQKVRR